MFIIAPNTPNPAKERLLTWPKFKPLLLQTIWMMALSAVFAFIITCAQEFILRDSMVGMLTFIQYAPQVFFENYKIIALICLLFLFLWGRVYAACASTAAIVLILSLINYYVMLFRGDVLSFDSLLHVKEAVSIVSNYQIKIDIRLLVPVAVLLACALLTCRMRPMEARLRYRFLFVAILLVGLFATVQKARGDISAYLGIPNPIYLPVDAYMERGFTLGFVRTIPDPIQRPAGYSEEKIDEMMASTQASTNDFVKPNIIFVMNEAFYDFSVLEEDFFTQEPIPYFKQLSKAYISGKMLVNVYGGSTCQTEYELLTGYSTKTTQDKDTFIGLIRTDTLSLPSILKKQGYETVSVHPFMQSFYNRQKVHRLLGFDRSLFFEDMPEHFLPDSGGRFVRDKFAYEMLINEFEKSEAPFFGFVVTMYNHGGYNVPLNNDHGIAVKNPGDFTESTLTELTVYGNQLRDVDNDLRELIGYFEQVDEPTVIVFCGDHSPALRSYLKESGKDSNEAPTDIVNLYTTKLLVWNNMGLPAEDLGYISSYMVAPQVLNRLGFHSDPYFALAEQLSPPPRLQDYYLLEDGWRTLEELDPQTIEKINTLWMLQYDRMFGAQYSEEADD